MKKTPAPQEQKSQEDTPTPGRTVGLRYLNEIKTRIGKLLSKQRDMKTKEPKNPDLEPLVRAWLKKTYGVVIPETLSINTNNTYCFKVSEDGSHVMDLRSPIVTRFQESSEYKKATKEGKEYNKLKADICTSLETYHELLTSARINGFKAYARAQFDKLPRVEKLTDTQFKKLISEYIASREEYTCKI